MIGRVIAARRHLEETQAASNSDRRALSRELRGARERKSAAALELRNTSRFHPIRRRRLATIYETEAEIIAFVRAALSE